MLKTVILFFVFYVFVGCAGSSFQEVGGNESLLSKKLQLQKEASDKEVRQLEQEIAKYEADIQKYREDYETFDNNPVLDILDETLRQSEDKNNTQIGEKI